jgi:hypothetical protein
LAISLAACLFHIHLSWPTPSGGSAELNLFDGNVELIFVSPALAAGSFASSCDWSPHVHWQTTGIFDNDVTLITLPFASIGAPASALVLLATWRRRLVPGYCLCGYTLQGLTSPLCPECGRGVKQIS